MNIQEYISLREELVARIQLVNTQENTALATSMGFWAANFAFYAVVMTANSSDLNIAAISLFQLILLFIPILLMILIAYKSGENLHQIACIATYLEVFYENSSISKPVEANSVYFWENANNETYKIRKTAKNNVFLFFINNCYAIISFVSTVLLVIEALFLLITYNELLSLKNSFNIASFALLILIMVATALTIVIFNQSSVKKNMIDVKERSFKTYTDLAKSMGIISN